jgi:SAM-dependent methyltransferase
MTPKNQAHKVRSFFNRIAADYPSRYEDPFLKFFYTERLMAATAGFDLEGKTILDIGAGTCALHTFLQEKGVQTSYFAQDIAQNMLDCCPIPAEKKFCGPLEEQTFLVNQFDFIFMLGVSNYMEPEDLRHTLSWIGKHLSPDGKAMVTFTHRKSADYRLIRFLKKPLRLFGYQDKGVTQTFESYAYTPKEVAHLLPEKLGIERLHWLNYSVFPFNRLLVKGSIRLARWLQGRKGEVAWLSSDFMIYISRRG